MAIINLVSDTVTKPTADMLKFMMKAQVGDDVFKEDPTVNLLQERMADMFGKESALFCPSGTMTNQIALKVHTNPLDEVICDIDSHIFQYETAGYAYNSGIAINPLQGKNGKITSKQIEQSIKPVFDWLPITKLVVIENTCNKGGGSYYTLDEIKPISELCKSKNLRLHLDGARFFNALAETNESCKDHGRQFDSISICLSKGLGAPVGSILIGDKPFIAEARRFRKVMGGGMRQAGYLAAAGLYAIDNNITRLKIDNARAKRIGQTLGDLHFVEYIKPIHTNIVIFKLKDKFDENTFIELLKSKGIHAISMGHHLIRFVFHLDITEDMMSKITACLENLKIQTAT